MFYFQISEDQPGWVRFRTKSSFEGCNTYSVWDTAHVIRKLNLPIIVGNTAICSSSQSYSISSSDAVSETYTWTATNGFKILKNNQYLTTYTGTETTIPVYSNGVTGNGALKVKANAQGYISSNETVKNIWGGVPTNNQIDFGVFFSNPPNNEVAVFDDVAVGILNNPSDALQGVTKYNWQLGDWSSYITGYQSNPSTILNTAVEIYLANYAPFSQIIQVYAENACGTDMIMATGKMFYTDDYGGYFMMSPNPADSYVELSFFANRELTDKDNVSQNKNCIKIKVSIQVNNNWLLI